MLSFLVGLALVSSGLTSIATQSQVFAANLTVLSGIEAMPVTWLAVSFLLIMTGIVFRGIRESMWVNVLCTLVEAGGLILVIAVGVSQWGSVDYLETPPNVDQDGAFLIVIQGAVLAFFAFIGFEDMYNVAEEVRHPERNLPLGLILAMAIAAILYVGIAITAVSVVPWAELAVSPGPITEVVARAAPIIPPIVFTAITLFAVANTALVNYVTASRLLYGMARQGLLPQHLGKVHAGRRTPHYAILAPLLVLVPLALYGTIAELAAATVLLLLIVFMVVTGRSCCCSGARSRQREVSRCHLSCRRRGLSSVSFSWLCGSPRETGKHPSSPAPCCSAPSSSTPGCGSGARPLRSAIVQAMRRMALVPAPIEPADISNRGAGTLGFDLERGDQCILGPDHDAVAPTRDADAYGELRLHVHTPLKRLSRRPSLAKEREPAHDYVRAGLGPNARGRLRAFSALV